MGRVKLSLCVEPLFPDLPLAERFANVAALGFDAVEFWHAGFDMTRIASDEAVPYFAALADAAKTAGLPVAGVLLGDCNHEQAAWPSLPQDEERMLADLRAAIPAFAALGADRYIFLTGGRVEGATREALVRALRSALPIAEAAGVTLLVEPLNDKVDHPGHFLTSAVEGLAIVNEIGHPNLKLLYDLYHMAVMGEEMVETIRNHIDDIGHFHIAGCPGRNELDAGTFDFGPAVRAIADSGYDGQIGFEYFPTVDSDESLKRCKATLEGYLA